MRRQFAGAGPAAVSHPASFRDPHARVLEAGDRILRELSGPAAKSYRAAREAGLVDRLVQAHLLIEHWEPTDASQPSELILESRRLPLISYPAEWSFSMLQDAALLTLDIATACLEAGFQLKDASAFNVTFDGSRPVFIDLGSVEQGFDGVWAAYGQFCDHFLAPLLLEGHLGVPFQQHLRGNLDGIPVGRLAPMFRGTARFRSGVPVHVLLRAMAERRGRSLDTERRRELRTEARLPRERILLRMRRMRQLVSSLSSSAGSHWADYASTCSYDEEQLGEKHRFVETAARKAGGRALAWDVGANAGAYAQALAPHFSCVVAMDADPGAVDVMYRSLREPEAAGNVVPLVVDVTDPPSDRGWRSMERTSLLGRGRPDFTIWLAIVHHLCLGVGIPLDEVVEVLGETSPEAVVEFVAPDDPMSRRLAATRRVFHPGYDLGSFIELVARRFETVDRAKLSPTRELFHLRRQ